MINVISFGGGVNSTAMILGLRDRKIPVDLILFADTGGEKPETYEFVRTLNSFIEKHCLGFPLITFVSDGRRSLEQECIEKHTLPSIVIGLRSCSDKYKIRPQDRFLAKWQPALDAWQRGERVVKLVGFDTSEGHRVKNYDTRRFIVRFPLIEWGWGREECLKSIEGNGIFPPPKSSCFFCPEMREHEIVELYKNNRPLFDRAVAMEDGNTSLYGARGLARTHSWSQIIDYHKNQLRLPIVGGTLPCICFDGE